MEAMFFCPNCGYEGADPICPVCETANESMGSEIEKIKEKEEEKSEIFDDEDISIDDLSEEGNVEDDEIEDL